MEYELKIDIDYKPENPLKFAKEFANKLKFTCDILKIEVEAVEVYETNKGFHIYVWINSKKELDNKDIIILQLSLGSDYKREIFNLSRVWSFDNIAIWNVLFSRKYDNGVLISKEEATNVAKSMTKLINRLLIEA